MNPSDFGGHVGEQFCRVLVTLAPRLAYLTIVHDESDILDKLRRHAHHHFRPHLRALYLRCSSFDWNYYHDSPSDRGPDHVVWQN